MASSAVQQVCQHTVFHVCQAKAPLGGKGAAAECRIACPRLQDWRRWGLDSGLAWNGIGIGSGSNGHSRQVVTARVGALFGVGPREEKPVAVELEPITGEEQFNALLAEAQAEGKRVVIEWMASWCRKCIYLKPKLERLAAEYHPNTRFFCIDVNAVPSTLVKRAEVTKMPTIQLWVDGEKKAEVIGGHKAWLVLDEIREMLQPDRV